MTREEAYQRLELPEGADIQEVRRQFAAMHNDCRMKIDNAPTARLRHLFGQQLAQLKDAYSLLNGSDDMDDTFELPRTKRGADEDPAWKEEQNAGSSGNASRPGLQEAYDYFGLSPEDDKSTCYKRIAAKLSGLEVSLQSQTLPSARKLYEAELEKAGKLKALLVAAREQKDGQGRERERPQNAADPEAKKASKRPKPATLVIIVGLLAILLGELAIYLLKPAGQGAYTACLEQAVAAAKNKDAKAFKTSLTRFSDTLDRNDIAPAALSKKNRALYTEALYQGMDRMGTTAISEATAAKALEFLRYDIENNPRNMLTLGRLYEAGKGVEQNDVLAGQWVERAAERGDVDAIYTIGSWYAFGVGRKEDYPKAISWLEKGSEKGDARAMVLLGLMYQEGIGVNRDYVQARHWYEQAAEKGNSEAMNSLGVLYAQGQGVAQDNAKADYWFEQVRKKQIVPDSAYFAFNKMFPVEKPSPMSFFSPHKVAQYASFKCSHGATDELLNEMKHVEKDTALGETFLSNLQLFGPDLERYENDRIYLAFYSYAKNRDVSVWYYYLVNEKGEFLEHKPWISLHRSNETGRCALTGIFEGTDDLMPAGVITN